VSHSRFPLNLFRRDSTARRSHQVDGIEPSRKRSGRLVEDRASGWVNVMAAMIAGVRRAAHYAMVLGHRFALDAVDAVRVEGIAKPLKAYGIGRELFVEVFLGVAEHLRVAAHGGYLP